MTAVRQYHAREGHVRVPRKHVETVLVSGNGGGVVEEHVRLGVWRSNVRSRRERLCEEQRREADGLGLFV